VLEVGENEGAKNSMEHGIPVTFPEDETSDIGQDARTGVAMLEHRYEHLPAIADAVARAKDQVLPA